ncbi:MAG TPA: methyltransferase domain-containing protein [Gaiellaceae bacterium]|nr:methyltransferase domain-containing protein [Gaiellaceae bacterium]
MEADETRRAWDALLRIREALTREPAGIPPPVRQLLPDLAGAHVLHERCGSGEASAELAALGALVTGIDPSAAAIGAARARFPQLLFLQADPAELPVQLRRRRFDAVYASGVLPFLDDLGRWTAETAAALREGGVLVAVDLHPAGACVDATSLRWRSDYFAGSLPVGDWVRPAATLRLWRLGELVTALAAGGFAVCRLEEFGSFSPVRRHDPRVPVAFALVARRVAGEPGDRRPSGSAAAPTRA